MPIKQPEPVEFPKLGDEQLSRAHLDRIHAWLLTKPSASEIQGLQQDLTSWTAKQKAMDKKTTGLNGLWRTTEVVRTWGEIEEEPADLDFDDIEGLEQLVVPDDASETWSDDFGQLFFFLEIRDGQFREMDASVYPLTSRTDSMDYAEMENESEQEESDSTGGILYDDGGFQSLITFDEQGFAKIANVKSSKSKTEVLLHRALDGDGNMIDRVVLSRKVLKRRAFLVWDGMHTTSVTMTYERFAMPVAI